MKLRQINNDTFINVATEDIATNALVTNNPHLINPSIGLGRIIVMPERSLVNIIAEPGAASRHLGVIDSLASKLLEEIQIECGEECKATTDTFTGDVPEISMIVVSAGVICGKAGEACPKMCPNGVRDVL